MACKLNEPCPYSKQCTDCLHYVLERSGMRYKKTGLDTSDMRAYKREYKRRARQASLQRDMQCAGVA